MGAMFVVAVLWLVGMPILALVLAAQARGRSRILTERLEAAEGRLAAIDTALLQRSPAAPPASTPPVAETIGPEPEPATAAREELPAEPLATSPAGVASEPEALASAAPLTAQVASPPDRPRESLESKIGARWTVLVGGLALALGAIFLVRYSIEQGLLTEGMRIALGFLLAAVLFAAGEYMRRRDRADAVPPVGADVPAVLTAAGGVAAFATVYAAYALYGFIGDAARLRPAHGGGARHADPLRHSRPVACGARRARQLRRAAARIVRPAAAAAGRAPQLSR